MRGISCRRVIRGLVEIVSWKDLGSFGTTVKGSVYQNVQYIRKIQSFKQIKDEVIRYFRAMFVFERGGKRRPAPSRISLISFLASDSWQTV